MIMNLALYTWREGTTREDVAQVEAALSRMPKVIPVLKEYHFGPSLGLRPGTAEFAVCAVMPREELGTYLDHPEHQRVVRDVISPLLASRTAVQISYRNRVAPAP
jgi:hypothetical protein